jgi:hypothetical protein
MEVLGQHLRLSELSKNKGNCLPNFTEFYRYRHFLGMVKGVGLRVEDGCRSTGLESPVRPSTRHLVASGVPFGDVDSTFGIGDGIGPFTELEGRGRSDCFGADLGAQLGGDAVEAGGGDFLEVAALNLLLDAPQLGSQLAPAFVPRAEGRLEERLGLGGAEVVDFELMLPAPLDERGLGDVQFDLDAVEAPALRAQEDEAIDGFQIVHDCLSLADC